MKCIELSSNDFDPAARYEHVTSADVDGSRWQSSHHGVGMTVRTAPAAGRAVGAARRFGTTGRQCVERASPTATTAVEERRIDRADVFNAGIRRSDPVKPAAAARVYHSPHQIGPEPSTTASARRFLPSDPMPNTGGGRV